MSLLGITADSSAAGYLYDQLKRWKMKNRILFVLSVLFGLLYINAGLNKFFNYMPVPEDLPEELVRVSTALAEVGWLMPLVGLIEIIGGALFIPKRLRPLGALVIFPITVGVLLINVTVAPSGIPMALFVLAVNLWVIFESRQKYLQLITTGPSNYPAE